jgi:hypothetical protein
MFIERKTTLLQAFSPPPTTHVKTNTPFLCQAVSKLSRHTDAVRLHSDSSAITCASVYPCQAGRIIRSELKILMTGNNHTTE